MNLPGFRLGIVVTYWNYKFLNGSLFMPPVCKNGMLEYWA